MRRTTASQVISHSSRRARSALIALGLGAAGLLGCSSDDASPGTTTSATSAPVTVAPSTTVAGDEDALPRLLPGYLPADASIVYTSLDAGLNGSLDLTGPGGIHVRLVATATAEGTLPVGAVPATVAGRDAHFLDASRYIAETLIWSAGDRTIVGAASGGFGLTAWAPIVAATTVNAEGDLVFSGAEGFTVGTTVGAADQWSIMAANDAVTVEMRARRGDLATLAVIGALTFADVGAAVVTHDVQVHDLDARVAEIPDSEHRVLGWVEHGVLLTVEADLASDELVRVAEGLGIVDDAAWHAAVDPYMHENVTADGEWNGRAWSIDLDYGAATDRHGSWCGDLLGTRYGGACTTEVWKAPVVWLVDSATFDQTKFKSDLPIFGITRLADAARIEVIDGVTGKTWAKGELFDAAVAPWRAFAVWPALLPQAEYAERQAFVVRLVDAAGTELATTSLNEQAVVTYGTSENDWDKASTVASGPGWTLRAAHTIVPDPALGVRAAGTTPYQGPVFEGAPLDGTPYFHAVGYDDEAISACFAGPGALQLTCLPLYDWDEQAPVLAYTWPEQGGESLLAVVSLPAGTPAAHATTAHGVTIEGTLATLPADEFGIGKLVAVFPIPAGDALASVTIAAIDHVFSDVPVASARSCAVDLTVPAGVVLDENCEG